MKVFRIRSEAVVSWMVRMTFYAFKSIGLAPISLQTKTRAGNFRNTSIKVFLFSKTGQLYNFVFVILLLAVDGFLISLVVSKGYSRISDVFQYLELTRYIIQVATSSFIIFYLAFRQKKITFIMNRLLDVHFLLSGPKEQLSNKWTCVFLSVQMAFNVILWTTVISTDLAYGSFLFTLADNLAEFIIYSFFIEYSIILGIITKEFEILNQKLLTLTDIPNYFFRTSLPTERLAIPSLTTRSQLTTLKSLHSFRTTLFEVSQDIADFFSLPVLFSVATFFFILIYAGYFFAAPAVGLIDDDSPIIYYLNNATWFIIAVYPLTLLSFNATETLNKAKLTGRIVHKLLASAREPEIIMELEQFSLELLHQDVSLTAYGFFSLDLTLMQSIFGGAVTYLVIMVQFVPSYKYADGSNTPNSTFSM